MLNRLVLRHPRTGLRTYLVSLSCYDTSNEAFPFSPHSFSRWTREHASNSSYLCLRLLLCPTSTEYIHTLCIIIVYLYTKVDRLLSRGPPIQSTMTPSHSEIGPEHPQCGIFSPLAPLGRSGLRPTGLPLQFTTVPERSRGEEITRLEKFTHIPLLLPPCQSS